MNETTVSKFHINNLLDAWVNKFDFDEAPARKSKNINVIFTGVSKDNPHKEYSGCSGLRESYR